MSPVCPRLYFYLYEIFLFVFPVCPHPLPLMTILYFPGLLALQILRSIVPVLAFPCAVIALLALCGLPSLINLLLRFFFISFICLASGGSAHRSLAPLPRRLEGVSPPPPPPSLITFSLGSWLLGVPV